MFLTFLGAIFVATVVYVMYRGKAGLATIRNESGRKYALIGVFILVNFAVDVVRLTTV